MADYKAIVVDDSAEIRHVVVEFLSKIGIEAHAYETAEELLAFLFPTAMMELEEMPDLLVIDLQLKENHMQGIELILELVNPKRNVPSSLMAMSGAIPSADFAEEIIPFGAAVLLPKPFGIKEFCPRAKRLAEIGRRRKLKRIEHEQNRLYHRDDDRKYRPVFISYAHEDEDLANGIRIHIESLDIDVWYGPTTLDGGDEWQSEIINGVSNAYVFIPVFSDHYLSSDICIDELTRFQGRLADNDQENLRLIPIVSDLSSRGRENVVFKSIANKYHYIEFRPRVADGLTSLTMTLQSHISRCNRQNRRLGEYTADAISYSHPHSSAGGDEMITI